MESSATFTAKASDRLRRIGRALVDGVFRRGAFLVVRSSNSLTRYAADAREVTSSRRLGACFAVYPFPIRWAECSLWRLCARAADWDRARAVLRYDKNSHRLLLGFSMVISPTRLSIRAVDERAALMYSPTPIARPGAAALDPALPAPL